MNKKTYISPEVVTVKLKNRPLLQPVSGFEQNPDANSSENANDGLAKGGFGGWDDDFEEDF